MNTIAIRELEHQRSRLAYYLKLKEKAGAPKKAAAKPTAVDRWIEIYSERVRKLERQASKLGLKVELGANSKHGALFRSTSAASGRA